MGELFIPWVLLIAQLTVQGKPTGISGLSVIFI